jgi:hypothetical protein
MTRRKFKAVRTLGGLAASAAIFLLLLEGALRLFPSVLGPRMANAVYSAYGAFPGGIYFVDRPTGVQFMRASYSTVNYFNGYRWHHRTDRFGFRDPPDLAERSVLLLGDSLIYGHGVEEEETVAHYLRSRYGIPAYNMARQGDCLFQEYVLLRTWTERFHPRRAQIFVFVNDFDDLLVYRSDEELADAPEIDRFDYPALRGRLLREGTDPPYPLYRQLYRSRALRLLRAIGLEAVEGPWMARAHAASPTSPLPYLRPILEEDTARRLFAYYRRLLGDLGVRLREMGVELEVVFLYLDGFAPGPQAREAQDRLDRGLDGLCAELGIPYRVTHGVFTGCRECFLPGDGHFTAEGHRRLAAFLASGPPDAELRAPSGGAAAGPTDLSQ